MSGDGWWVFIKLSSRTDCGWVVEEAECIYVRPFSAKSAGRRISLLATHLDPDLQNRITIFRARPGQTKAAAARQHRKRAQKLNADPTHALIYTDGSLRPVRGANTAGAGVAVYCHGDVVKERSVGLGHEMEVYDAELYGLQLGASTAAELALATARDDCPTIRHLHFFSDNDSAVGRVTEQSCKKGQSLAEAFWRSMLTFLDSDPSHTIE
ncbi:hypothetical protein FRB90_011269, partial [Tulasnella sp. 427]